MMPAAQRADFAACSGCSLCLLVCPAWRRTRDLRDTPHGRAKALQHGVAVVELKESIESCTLCGACEPVCPENIDLVGMLLELRRQLPPMILTRNITTNMQAERPRENVALSASTPALVAGGMYFGRPALLARIKTLLGSTRGITVANDNGADIALALEIGATVPPQRIERFLAPLRAHKTIVLTDGLLLRQVRAWLPAARVAGLGEALGALAPLRRQLRAGDLYVIDPRAYHADHERLVTHYDGLRAETGCTLNLDLQRIAIPATARSLRQRLGADAIDDAPQLRWLLQGRTIARIVVESESDRFAIGQLCTLPVVHLAELADDPSSPEGKQS